MPDRPIYRLDIRDDGRGANSPEINRLRIVLKRLLRTFGFKCLRVEQLTTNQRQEPGTLPGSMTTTFSEGE